MVLVQWFEKVIWAGHSASKSWLLVESKCEGKKGCFAKGVVVGICHDVEVKNQGRKIRSKSA